MHCEATPPTGVWYGDRIVYWHYKADILSKTRLNKNKKNIYILKIIHLFQVLWTFSIYLEAVAILPQLFLVSKTGEAESITSHYLFALGSYRALYLLNWVCISFFLYLINKFIIQKALQLVNIPCMNKCLHITNYTHVLRCNDIRVDLIQSNIFHETYNLRCIHEMKTIKSCSLLV